MSRLANGWRRLFRLARPERDVDDELAFHLAMREEKGKALGLDPAVARDVARQRFGDAERIRAECVAIDRRYAREVRIAAFLTSVRGDLRIALRSLRRTPVFALVAIATLAIGIGATSAMFSLVDAILLRPLPYQDPSRLVSVTQVYPELGLDNWSLSDQNVAQYRDRVPQFASFAGYSRRGQTLSVDGRPERVNGLVVTGDFFRVLGVPPMLGRAFTPDDDRQGANDVAILSYGFWRSRFGGDRSVVGRVVDIDERPVRIIGVMPEGFASPRADVQLYRPLGLDPHRTYGFYLTGLARLAPGASLDAATRSSTAVMHEWARHTTLVKDGVDPSRTRMKAQLEPLRDRLTGSVRAPLMVLQAAVGLILLIVIANVATLVTARSTTRARELALRQALGASRWRLLRQLLTESVTLAALGGVVGVILAAVVVRAFTRSPMGALPRVGEVALSWDVVAFAAVTTMVSGIVFGIAPAAALRDRSRQAMNTRRIPSGLVVTQLSISIVLLVSAGLVLKSFRRLIDTNLGFDPSHVTVVALPLPAQKYSAPERTLALTDAVVARVRAAPGVEGASMSWTQPFGGNENTDGYVVEGRTAGTTSGAEAEQAVWAAVGPGYFATLRLPLLFGRDFTTADRSGSEPVTIVDDALASRFWKGGDAIGKRIRATGDTTWRTIVGVVGSVRDQDVASGPRSHMYLAFAQFPDPRPVLLLRTSGDPAAAIGALRQIVREIEPGIPLDNIRPLDSWVARSLDTRRLTEMLLAAFAGIALLLASVGLYGVMTLFASNRRREFGIRLAVGAQPSAVLRLVLRQGLALAALGVVLGIGGAIVATRWVRGLLYDVSPTDPAVYATFAAVLLVVAGVASLLPALRAARSDPLIALRAE